MAMPSIRRRIGKLESESDLRRPRNYPPFTSSEIVEVARRVREGGRFANDELRRLEQLSPLVDGEFLITAFRGNIAVKRYGGVDLGEI